MSLTVNKATPAITWATPAPIAYGTALSAAQLNATASVPGKFVYTPAAGEVLPAGLTYAHGNLHSGRLRRLHHGAGHGVAHGHQGNAGISLADAGFDCLWQPR